MEKVIDKNTIKEEKRRLWRKIINRDKYLLLMIIPVVIYYIIFCYFPMTGIVMAFNKYRTGSGLIGLYTSEFVGFKWFKQFFSSVYAWRLVRNTFLLNFYSLIFGFPIPILFAVAITQIYNERIQKVVQVSTYLHISFPPLYVWYDYKLSVPVGRYSEHVFKQIRN